jgi:hypothetical protein
MSEESDAKHEEIEKLAYRRWEERGGPFGSPKEDWFHAEQEIIQRSSWPLRLPFSSLTMEPVESWASERNVVGPAG